MNRVLLAVIACVLAAGIAPSAFAWSFSADVPVHFAFDKKSADTKGNGQFERPSTTDVSGYKVALKTPFFLGVGYEDYTIKENLGTNLPLSPAQVEMTFTDVFVELPIQVFNVSLGYGVGSAALTGSQIPKSKPADAQQGFLVIGLPLGKMLDVHVGYHWIDAQHSDFTGAGAPGDKTQLSGQMVSAGLRLGM
jgi:opacity protein-like surface antigen